MVRITTYNTQSAINVTIDFQWLHQPEIYHSALNIVFAVAVAQQTNQITIVWLGNGIKFKKARQ